MVLNWLFENLQSCINLTDGYHPRNKLISSVAPKIISILMACVVPKFSKNNLPNNFSYNYYKYISLSILFLDSSQPQIYPPINRDFIFSIVKTYFLFFFFGKYIFNRPAQGFSIHPYFVCYFIVYICMIKDKCWVNVDIYTSFVYFIMLWFDNSWI